MMMEAEIGGMWPQPRNTWGPQKPWWEPTAWQGAPPLVPASVGVWSQPSAAGESPRNRASVGPWNLGLAPPLPAVLPLSDGRKPS